MLVRSSDHYLQVVIPVSKLETSQLSREEVINFIGRTMGLRTLFKQAHLPDIEQELLRVDETFVKSHMKVGLLRIKAKQRTEEEIFSNEQEPGPYDEFLNLLGQRVKLMGFKRFLGGLDADHNLTGEESVFVEYKGIEVMFHVATLMPFTANDPQQVTQAKHLATIWGGAMVGGGGGGGYVDAWVDCRQTGRQAGRQVVLVGVVVKCTNNVPFSTNVSIIDR